jgi:hypothetical protein
MAPDVFRAVDDGTLCETLLSAVAAKVRRLADGSMELLRSADLHAVPAASTAHFTRSDEARVAEAFTKEGCSTVYAVVMETLKNQPPVFAMASTKEGIREFQRACSHFNYALSTPDASAIVVCSTGDYLIFIGSQPFVEQCAGTEEAAAFRLFREYADNPGWPDPKVRRNLQSIYTTLAQEFPGAPEGTFVKLQK